MIRNVLIAASLVCLVGCATTPKLNTPSSKPEVIIPNVEKKAVIDALTNAMISRGYTIQSATDYSMVFGKRVDTMGARLAYGSRYDGVPEARVSFAIMDTSEGVRIVTNLVAVTNPGSAFEKMDQTPASNFLDPHEFQRMLEELAASFKSEPSVGS